MQIVIIEKKKNYACFTKASPCIHLFIYLFIYIYGHFNIIYVELILNSASASRFCHTLARPVCTVSHTLYSF